MGQTKSRYISSPSFWRPAGTGELGWTSWDKRGYAAKARSALRSDGEVFLVLRNGQRVRVALKGAV